MNMITIANIARKDFEQRQIRILAAQKELFPAERRGFPKACDVTVIWKDLPFNCAYRIGSTDGRVRSAVLHLKDGLAEAMSDWVGKSLGVERIGHNKYHLIPAGL